jgi:hypothetical protein
MAHSHWIRLIEGKRHALPERLSTLETFEACSKRA